jgi:hypothetical protein
MVLVVHAFGSSLNTSSIAELYRICPEANTNINDNSTCQAGVRGALDEMSRTGSVRHVFVSQSY